jgi:hypothetical protein
MPPHKVKASTSSPTKALMGYHEHICILSFPFHSFPFLSTIHLQNPIIVKITFAHLEAAPFLTSTKPLASRTIPPPV